MKGTLGADIVMKKRKQKGERWEQDEDEGNDWAHILRRWASEEATRQLLEYLALHESCQGKQVMNDRMIPKY